MTGYALCELLNEMIDEEIEPIEFVAALMEYLRDRPSFLPPGDKDAANDYKVMTRQLMWSLCREADANYYSIYVRLFRCVLDAFQPEASQNMTDRQMLEQCLRLAELKACAGSEDLTPMLREYFFDTFLEMREVLRTSGLPQ